MDGRRPATTPPTSQSGGRCADDGDEELGGDEQSMDGRRPATTPPTSQSGGRCADDGDEELGVFTAERYFNGALAAEDALWCDRSSSSFSSAFKTGQREGSAPTPTAATSSSEASWNSRSALLPNSPVVAAAPAVEAKPSRAASEHTGRKPSSSSHLRRWLCACAGSDGEESVSADVCPYEVDAGPVLGGKKRSTEADAMLPRRTSKETAVEEVTMVRVRPGKWVHDGDPFLAGAATLVPAQPAEAGHRRAANSGESSMRILNPTTTASSEERRRKSLDMFRPAGQGSTLVSAKQNSAFTIVAGSTARGGAASASGGGRGSPDLPHRACGSRRDSGVDDAAPSELECMYPPSEASVVWSVVTAEGAASGNFSSAASGYYYYYNDGYEEAALRNTAAAKSNRRSSSGRINGSSGLLMGCMSERAVDAIGLARASVHRPEVEPAVVARLSAATAGRSGPDVMRRG